MLQRSQEWYAARLGKVGASRIADLMARTKTGYSASRTNLMAELVCERLTGAPTEGYVSPAMQWGVEKEPEAKTLYSLMTNRSIEDVGFVDHPSIAMTGASPDGLVGSDGLVEFKCPNTATHLETLLTENIDGKYILQVQWQMACTGRAWCDYVSFDPRLPPEMQLWKKAIPRSDTKIAEIETEVRKFLEELDAKVEALRSRYGEAA